MKIALLLASFALLLAAPAARAQTADAQPSLPSMPPIPARSMDEPLPAALIPSRAAVAAQARDPTERLDAQTRRSPWRYPAIGAVAGALAGAAFGTALMVTADEWIAPPAHLFTVPAGAVLGMAIGGVANLIDRP